MSRGATSSVLHMVSAAGVQLAANAGAGLLATAWLPVSERGLMVIMLSVSAIISLVATLGIGNSLRAQIALVSGAARSALLITYTRLAVYIVIGAAILAAGASALLLPLDSRMATGAVISGIALACAVQVASTLLTDARFARGEFGAGSRWAATAALAGVVGMASAYGAHVVFGWAPTAAALTLSQYVFFGMALIPAGAAAFRVHALVWRRGRVSGMPRLLAAGSATIVLPVAIVLVTRSDRLILGAVATAAAVAVYALATTYAEMLRVVPTAIGQLATSRVAHGAGAKVVTKLAAVSLLVTAAIGAVLMLVAHWVTVPVFGADYSEAVSTTLALLPGEFFYALVVLCNLALIGGAWSRVSVWIGVISVPVALAAFWWGASVGGMLGLAFARDAVFGLMATATVTALYVCLFRRSRSARSSVDGEPGLPPRQSAAESTL